MKKIGRISVKGVAITGVFAALVFVATLVVNFPSPFSLSDGGLIHFGNVPLIIAAIVFDKRKGALAGAFGMALFDIVSSYAVWAPFTFVISGLSGYAIGYIAEKKRGRSMRLNIAAIAAGGVIRIAGYYIAELIIYQNPVAPLLSMPGDVIQITLAGIITVPLLGKLITYKERFIR